MLCVEHLDQYYGESHTLWDVELTVSQGDCLCLLGRNGVGKTTLLKSIMGLVRLRDGSITFDGISLERMPASARASAAIGYVPQGRDIFPQLTVEENLRVGQLGRRKNAPDPTHRIYELFPILKSMSQRRGGDLSGGQQQQLAIGRALALAPKLLILDEPTEGIQPNIVSEIGEILLQLQQEGLTILLVEQKLKFAQRVAQSFAILDRGRMVANGPMLNLSNDLVKRYLVV
jgi:urea transport system ATP-binding protein